MIPSVPSEPTNTCVRSGPAALRGAPPVVIPRPSASTTSRPITMSSIFPYRVEYWPAPRQASQPPTVEMSIDWGQWPRVSPRARRSASRSGPNVPGRTVTVRLSSSTAVTPTMAVRSRRTPPARGTLAPHTPLRPPAAVTGMERVWQTRRTAATSPASAGRHTTSASPPTWPASAQCMASGHQSRLASARRAGSVTVSGQAERSAATATSSMGGPSFQRPSTAAGAPEKPMGGVGTVTLRPRRRRPWPARARRR